MPQREQYRATCNSFFESRFIISVSAMERKVLFALNLKNVVQNYKVELE